MSDAEIREGVVEMIRRLREAGPIETEYPSLLLDYLRFLHELNQTVPA